MEITDIKQSLTLATVLQHYGLKPDKNLRLLCPFHDDHTPSLQVYYKTHSCYCFSSNCKTHGKSIDVIDFIMYMEGLDAPTGSAQGKAQAIQKAKELAGGTLEKHPSAKTRETFLQNIFHYFKNAVHNSPPAQSYLAKRYIDYKQIEVGYNGGQFHHGQRKSPDLINQSLEYGLLLDRGMKSKTGEPSYQAFGKNGIVFPLKNPQNQIVSLYFRSIINEADSKHYYLKDRQGLYPGYPKPQTKTLILTEAIIDAATLSQHVIANMKYEDKRSKAEFIENGVEIIQKTSVLACYGTNGLTEEHQEAIQSLKELEEIIFFFDGDPAGRKAVTKYTALLKELLPSIKITNIDTPENEDINSLLQGHDHAIYKQLINDRKPIDPTKDFTFAVEPTVKETPNPQIPESPNQQPLSGHPHNLIYTTETARYTAKGVLKNQQDSLKIALQIQHPQHPSDYRTKIDLYEYKQLQQAAKSASESLQLNPSELEKDLMHFTHLLEQYKETHTDQKTEKPKVSLPQATLTACINFLKHPDLLDNLNEKIGSSGIVGEEENRLFLFIIATSYKMPDTLHALIQGSSGSGKTRLLKTISRLMPPEDTKHFTRVTDNSFYNYGEYDLENKLLCFEDIDGLKEDALLALRELQSNDILISSTSQKDDNGHIRSMERTVRGPIASFSATTKGNYYEDNISRSFVVAVDESHEQTQRIITYQNNKAAGIINTKQEEQNQHFIQNCVRLLKPLEVINPYANKIQLPQEAHKIRRLNEMYQSIIKQIVIIHQYQRHQDQYGRLIAQKEDLNQACNILFESIVLKVDELEGNLRQFFEKLKQYIEKKAQSEKKNGFDIRFNRFEIRIATGINKTQQHRYMQQLLMLEYITRSGFPNRGYTYQITHWDNIRLLRSQIKKNLQIQLEYL